MNSFRNQLLHVDFQVLSHYLQKATDSYLVYGDGPYLLDILKEMTSKIGRCITYLLLFDTTRQKHFPNTPRSIKNEFITILILDFRCIPEVICNCSTARKFSKMWGTSIISSTSPCQRRYCSSLHITRTN